VSKRAAAVGVGVGVGVVVRRVSGYLASIEEAGEEGRRDRRR